MAWLRRNRPTDSESNLSADDTSTDRLVDVSVADEDTLSGVNSDDPITSIEADRLGRITFARQVASRIDQAGIGSSVVFGLAGPWGSGKTSALAMVRSALTAEEIRGWAVVEFTPWAATDPLTLTEEFYNAIASGIPDKEQGKKARALLRSAGPVGSAVMKAAAQGALEKYLGEGTWKEMSSSAAEVVADRLGDYQPNQDPFQERFKKISKSIRAARTKVLVIVDDLDRLHVDELLAVLKAVRLLGRFPGVHYLLSYDQQTIEDLLCSSELAKGKPDRATAYLEKIVQYPFVLPPLQVLHLEDSLREQLNHVAEQHGLLTMESTSHSRPWDAVDELLSVIPNIDTLTLRAVTRWCSQIDIMLSLVGSNELDLIDSALVTYLRLHHHHLHDVLPRWSELLVGDVRKNDLSKQTERSEDDWKAELTELPLGQSDADGMYRLLQYLFPRLPRTRSSRSHPDGAGPRVHDKDYFDRYFAFTLPAADVSDGEVTEDLECLAETGVLPPDGVVRAALADNRRRQLALRKIDRSLNRVITHFTAESALLALSGLSNLLMNDQGRFSPFDFVRHRIAVTLLDRTIQGAESDSRAREHVNEFRGAVGLAATTDLLATFRRGSDVYADPRTTAALADVRTDVLHQCILDFTSEVPPQEGGVLAFVDFLVKDMWEELRAEVRTLALPQDQLAARFVSLRGARDEAEFYSRYFSELIPANEWDLDQFPPEHIEDGSVDSDDPLVFKTMKAARAVREILVDGKPVVP